LTTHVIPLPTHIYIPGLTIRHPEGAFDLIRETATDGMTPEQLAQSDAFCTGLRFIRAGYFWEAHEVLEPVWMVLPSPSVERDFVQGLIQIANGLLKIKMDRQKAALRLAKIARDLMPPQDRSHVMGVSLVEIDALIDSLEAFAYGEL